MILSQGVLPFSLTHLMTLDKSLKTFLAQFVSSNGKSPFNQREHYHFPLKQEPAALQEVKLIFDLSIERDFQKFGSDDTRDSFSDMESRRNLIREQKYVLGKIGTGFQTKCD